MTLSADFFYAIYALLMNSSVVTLGRWSRLALLLLLLAAQGVAVAHDLDSSHSPAADSCAICITGHGLGAAVAASCDTPSWHVLPPQPAVQPVVATLAGRSTCHLARAPPFAS